MFVNLCMFGFVFDPCLCISVQIFAKRQGSSGALAAPGDILPSICLPRGEISKYSKQSQRNATENKDQGILSIGVCICRKFLCK